MNNEKGILLVEDNPKDRELTLEVMGKYNLVNNLVAVSDGVEALAFLRREDEYTDRPPGLPALILLDIKLPRMDGLEFLEVIKKDKALKHIPVVMLTSSREDTDLKKSYDTGANAYVVKPVDFKDFIEAVRHLGIFWLMINEIPE